MQVVHGDMTGPFIIFTSSFFMEVLMKQFSGLMALVAFLSFSAMSTLSFAGEEKKEEKQGGNVVVFSDDKKEEHKDKGGHVVVFSDDKKEEAKDQNGK
jgi:hypothetical protein